MSCFFLFIILFKLTFYMYFQIMWYAWINANQIKLNHFNRIGVQPSCPLEIILDKFCLWITRWLPVGTNTYAVCNTRLSGYCKIELGYSYLLWSRTETQNKTKQNKTKQNKTQKLTIVCLDEAASQAKKKQTNKQTKNQTQTIYQTNQPTNQPTN